MGREDKFRWEETWWDPQRTRGVQESGGCERHGLPEEIDPFPIVSAMDLLNYCLVTFIEQKIFLQVKEERYS
jgi:hypothetical protein